MTSGNRSSRVSAYGVNRDTFNRVEFDPVTTTAVRIEVEPKTVHYKTGEIGPPAAMFLDGPGRVAGVRDHRMAGQVIASNP